MSLWIGNKEVGLAPGQTEGVVGGEYVIRDPTSDISKPYVEAGGIQTTSGYPGDRVLVEVGGQRFYTGRGEIPEIGQYRRDTGYTSVRRTGMMTPAEIERQYQEQKGVQPVQLAPSPFQSGQVQYMPGSPIMSYQRQQYPSTPIDYSRTHVSELTTYPLYKGAAYISRGLQSGYERVVDIQPFPEPIKEAQKGFGSLFTGIPEFLSSGISGWEYAAREPEVFKSGIIPAGKMFGAGLVSQATERPFYTLGQAAGIGYGMRGLVKTPSISGIKTKLSFEPASGIQSFREILPTIKIEPSSRIGDLRAAGEVLSGYKTGFLREYQKPSLQAEKAIIGRETVAYFGEGIKAEFAKPTMGKEAVSSVYGVFKEYKAGLGSELAKPTLRKEALASTSQLFRDYRKGIGYELSRPTRGKEAVTAAADVFRGYKTSFVYELSKPTMRKQAIVGMRKAFGELRMEAGMEMYKPTTRATSFYAAKDIIKGYGVGIVEAYKGTAYKPPVKLRGEIITTFRRPTEARTIDLSMETKKPIFPETEGTPLPRAKYPYGMAYAEKITYPKSSKFQIIGKGLKHEAWGEKPISPTEYFGSITRGRFMTGGDIAGTNKIFGGRYRKGEVDPWAGKPTMRQSAEARGETLKRTISTPKIKTVEPIGGTELKYGKQSLIAVMEEPKPVTKTIAKVIPVALTQSRQKAISVSKTRQRVVTPQAQRTSFEAVSISRQVTPQVSGFAMGSPTIAVQTPKAIQRQIYRTEQIVKPIQKSVSIEIPITAKIQKPKTSSVDLFPTKLKRKGKRGGFKFPELTNVATPKQIMKGFKL